MSARELSEITVVHTLINLRPNGYLMCSSEALLRQGCRGRGGVQRGVCGTPLSRYSPFHDNT